ncbi:4Fe-4S binding protein [Methanocaldococcus sp.]
MVRVKDNCVGCGVCVAFCKKRALKTDGRAYINKELCNNCNICVKYCPINALEAE